MTYAISRAIRLITLVLMLMGLPLRFAHKAYAQPILEDQGTIEPAQQEYVIEAEAGDVLAIIVTSGDFDPVLSLLDANGEEVAVNDDFGGTLNSRIVYRVATAGEYTIVARSFDGRGGDYALEVRPATDYEIAFSQAQTQSQNGDFDGAIAAYTEAIRLEPDNPESYLGRADAYFGQVSEALGSIEQPSDLPAEARAAIIADYQKAAELFDAANDPLTAESLREQIEFLETGGTEAP